MYWHVKTDRYLQKDPSKTNDLYLREFGRFKYEVLQLLMERKVALIETYENYIVSEKPPDLLIERLNDDVLALTNRLQYNQSFENIYGFSCFYLLSRYPDNALRENIGFTSNVERCLRSIEMQLLSREEANFSISNSIKLIDIKVNLEKYTLKYQHRPIRI